MVVRSIVSALLIGTYQFVGFSTAAADQLRPFPLPLDTARDLPFDVDVARVKSLDAAGRITEAQREFDILSWQVFLALNWPATPDGRPDKSKGIADVDAPRVWSFWRQAGSIYRIDGATPARWNPVGSNTIQLTRTKAAWRQHSSNDNSVFQAFSGPLVDQNGKWVRYDVLVNHEEFDYLVDNTLYNQDGQVAFSRRASGNAIDFPADDKAKGRHGAIEIKLAWKELGPSDDRSRFLVRHVEASLSEPAVPGKPYPLTRTYDAGLVGMHIAMRTRSSPEWIWATFEQVDNVRVNKTANGRPVKPSFFNPSANTAPNVLPAKNAVIDPATGEVVPAPTGSATTWIESLTTDPVQVVRVEVPLQPNLNELDELLGQGAKALNAEVQNALGKANSVFQYYELIGTQWPIAPSAPAFPGGEASAPDSIRQKTPGMMVPVFLMNTTMETYFQKGLQAAGQLEQDDRLAAGSPPIDATMVTGTESCVGCHFSAGAAIGFKKDPSGKPIVDPDTKKRVPIFGENGNFGQTGNAHFSWLMQIEADSKLMPEIGAKGTPLPRRTPAQMLAVKK